MRNDLGMRRGKQIAQGAHASIAFLSNRLRKGEPLSAVEREWIDGIFTKICVRVDSEQELLEVHHKALESGLVSHLITDSGLTEFHGVRINTCCAIGPDESEKFDRITGHLKLL